MSTMGRDNFTHIQLNVLLIVPDWGMPLVLRCHPNRAWALIDVRSVLLARV